MNDGDYIIVVDTREQGGTLAELIRAEVTKEVPSNVCVHVRSLHLEAGDILVAAVNKRTTVAGTNDDADVVVASEAPVEATTTMLWPAGSLVVANDTTIDPLVLIERKAGDLVASIESGHLHQQKARKRQYRAETGCIPVLLIEGTHKYMPTRGLVPQSGGRTHTRPFGYRAVRTLMNRARFRDNMFVLTPADLEHTAEEIVNIVRVLSEDRVRRVTDIDALAQRSADIGVTVRKSDNKTPETFYVHSLLGGVPGVSKDLARAIQRVHPTKRALDDAYDACASLRDRETLLSAIERPGSGVKKRRLGPALSKRIYEFAGRAPPSSSDT